MASHAHPFALQTRLDDSETLALRERVRAEQVRLLYRGLPFSTSGTALAAVVFCAVMWNVAPHNWLLGWVALVLVNQLWRVMLYVRFSRAAQTPAEMDTWANYWALGSLLSGCLWGAATFLFFIPDSEVHQAFLIVLVFGVVAAAVLLIGAHMPSFYAFVIPALAPIVVRTTIEGEPAQLVLALIAGVTALAIISFGRNYNRTLLTSLENRFENEALADRLALQNLELERAKSAADTARNDAEVANRSKTQFFAAASHDLRQPLHAMGLFAAALSEKVRDPEVLNVVHSINASVEALETLFNELLDISKLDAGVIQPSMQTFPLQPLFDRLRMDFEPEVFERGLSLRVRPSAAYVYSDPVLVERILRNLLMNAARYTNAGGILLAARRRGNAVSLEVWDTGIGIPPTERERIFEEFYQLGNPERNSRKGLGLGLSIVKRLANLLNAPVTVTSAPGRGSSFRVRLPMGAAPKPGTVAPRTRGADPHDFAGRLVVVVEDESAVLEGMRVLLEGWNASVVPAAAASEALDKLQAAARAPDLIISDYRLREGLTGTQAITAIRERFGSDIPAILVTGSTTPAHIEEAKALDAHLLLKPVMPAKLRSLIAFKLSR